VPLLKAQIYEGVLVKSVAANKKTGENVHELLKKASNIVRGVKRRDIICKECHGEILMGGKAFTHFVHEPGL
jgi:hypothetical protein